MFIFITILLVVSVSLTLSDKPNIILIVADDLGWHDVEFHDSEIKTPHLNSLRSEGITLKNYFVQAICTPSRSQLLSGRYQIHTGLQHDLIWAPQPNGLPLNDSTIADQLKEQGYATHMVGKWHLGFYKKEYTPLYRGFDTFYGYLTQAEGYYNHSRCSNMPGETVYCGYDLWDNDKIDTSKIGQYSTHLFTEKSIDIINNHDNDQPLFIYLPYQGVHTPLEVPESYIEQYKYIEDADRRTYAGMVTCLDEGIGNVTAALKERGMWDNTILIFTTDNGGQVPHGGNNWPLRGYKFTWWDGGLRGVGLVASPLLKSQGVTSDDMMHVSDWYPTIVSLAGGDTTGLNLDGYDMWETLSKKHIPSPRSEILINIDPLNVTTQMTRYPHQFDTRIQASIRNTRWKLLTGDPGTDLWVPPPELIQLHPQRFKSLLVGRKTKPVISNPHMTYDSVKLYDMSYDFSEVHDCSSEYPEVVREMLDRLSFYNQTVAPCQYPPSDPNSDPALHGGVWGPWMD